MTYRIVKDQVYGTWAVLDSRGGVVKAGLTRAAATLLKAELNLEHHAPVA